MNTEFKAVYPVDNAENMRAAYRFAMFLLDAGIPFRFQQAPIDPSIGPQWQFDVLDGYEYASAALYKLSFSTSQEEVLEHLTRQKKGD